MFPDNVGTKIRNFEKPDRVRNDERKFKLICAIRTSSVSEDELEVLIYKKCAKF